MRSAESPARAFAGGARLFGLLVVALYVAQLVAVERTAARHVGVLLESAAGGLRIDEVTPDGPAARAGIEVDDLVMEIDGRAIDDTEDYDAAAANFDAERQATFRVLRDGRPLVLTVTPGRPAAWLPAVINGLLVGACLLLAWILIRRWDDLRARLLCWLLLLAAFELALPWDTIGFPGLFIASQCLYPFAVAGQIAVGLHLAAVIPSRSAWLARRPRLPPLGYAALGLLALASAAAFLAEEVWELGTLAWMKIHPDVLLLDIGLPAGLVLATLVLMRTALRHPRPQGRAQAGLVLFGMVPWTVQTLWTTAIEYEAMPSADTTPLYAAGVLIFAVAVFVAIFRYRLFDIALVVRRGMLYTLLSAVMIGILYGALALRGARASRQLDDEVRLALWLLCAVAFALGLLFTPLRRAFQRLIDRGVFPERRALRGELIALARELPTLGKLPRMSRHLTSQVRALFGARTAALLLADPTSGMLTTLVSKPGARANTQALPVFLPPGDPAIDRLRRAGRPRALAELMPLGSDLETQLRGLDAELLVPLLSHDQLVGVLVLGPSDEGQYSAEHKELLHLLAQHAATVFENVRLFESATYESMTGLLRREAILEVLAKEVERARRYHRPLTVAMADLDHFKRVNDRYGHLTGDTVLKRVARELASGLRATDAVGRYGGEEFLIVLPETAVDRAALVAEDIRHRISSLRVPVEGGGVVSVRVSIGLVGLEEIDDDEKQPVRALISCADRALYRAKGAGRDRVESSVIDAELIARVRAEAAARRRTRGHHPKRNER